MYRSSVVLVWAERRDQVVSFFGASRVGNQSQGKTGLGGGYLFLADNDTMQLIGTVRPEPGEWGKDD